MVRVSLGTKGISVDWKEGGNPIKPPPKGLEPHGDSGWYHSPDVVDPRDCQFYPDSPWCGGNPIDIGVEIGAEINVDPCGFTVDISGSTLIKFPHRVETYRYPGACRREYEKPPDAIPPPPPPGDYSKPPATPIPSGFGGDEYVCVVITQHRYGFESSWNLQRGDYANANYDSSTGVSGIEFPSFYLYSGVTGLYQPPQPASSRVKVETTAYTVANDSFNQKYRFDHNTTSSKSDYLMIDSRQAGTPKSSEQYYPEAQLLEGRFADIFTGDLEPDYDYRESIVNYPAPTGPRTEVYCDIVTYNVAYCVRKPSDTSRHPPSILPDPRDCCMQCCSSSSPQQQNNDDLLKKIYALLQQVDKNLGHAPIRVSIFDQNENAQEAQSTTLSLGSVVETLPKIVERIEKVSKIIGIDALPLTVPETISDPINDNILEAVWDWLTPDATRKINNLFEWNVWMLEQFSSVMGHWQQEISVEDTDALKPGDQGVPSEGGTTKKKIVLTDIATTLKEQTMLQLQLYKTLGLTLDVCLKTLTEGSSNAQQIAAIKAEINEIIDFLDYPTDDGYVDCPVQITVPGVDVSQEEQNDLAKFLKPTHSKVKYQNWSGKESLRDRFIHLATLLSRPQH